jgi:hypothetical protein
MRESQLQNAQCPGKRGYAPLCFPADISTDMVREFCEVLKKRREDVSG